MVGDKRGRGSRFGAQLWPLFRDLIVIWRLKCEGCWITAKAGRTITAYSLNPVIFTPTLLLFLWCLHFIHQTISCFVIIVGVTIRKS